MKNEKKEATTDLNSPNGSRDIPFQIQAFEQEGRRHFCRILASFSLKYDLTDGILPDDEKIKKSISQESLVLFEILRAVRTWQRTFA